MRKHELAANVAMHLPIIVGFGLVLVTLWPANLAVILVLYACGLADLVYAKLPLFRHGVFNSFGRSHIPMQRREAYLRGYRRIWLGIAFNCLALVHYFMAGAAM